MFLKIDKYIFIFLNEIFNVFKNEFTILLHKYNHFQDFIHTKGFT